jgi:hypothetical protein
MASLHVHMCTIVELWCAVALLAVGVLCVGTSILSLDAAGVYDHVKCFELTCRWDVVGAVLRWFVLAYVRLLGSGYFAAAAAGSAAMLTMTCMLLY